MFRHEVLEGLDKLIKSDQMIRSLGNNSHPEMAVWLRAMFGFISNCHGFHLGHGESLFHLYDFDRSEAPLCKDVSMSKLPYPITWFDFYRPMDEDGELVRRSNKLLKQGMLCVELPNNLIKVIPFMKFPQDDGWGPAFCEGEVDLTKKHVAARGITAQGRAEPDYAKVMETVFHEVTYPGLILVEMGLKFLHSKNVVRQKQTPSPQLQKKRARRGKRPFLSYWVLKLPKIGTLSVTTGQGAAKRQHWCRGHFKTFTIDKPLLGRATGTYWWNPQVRGKARGKIRKDYDAS